ncbi:cellulose synthase (UDP-forming) [Micromonospora sp. A200]|uniref:glycosyltransferase family 2 protein n=1 Tax=Micromonospora sp. A200 TaxID=2940568 RepID=UPI00247558DD|nr:glycosyltransferase family 2 protein [Micromonospora sp. A200]MDH6463975.1 cellulose synthase (UDP-forming) [Micromonospora sp. A200]
MSAPARPAPETLDTEIRNLSGGRVLRAGPGGPIFAPFRYLRATRAATFVSALRWRDRVAVAGLTAGWATSFVAFWLWWWQPAHRVGWAGLALNSLLMLYLTGLPGYFLLAVSRLRQVNPALGVSRLRVAFVVTHVPSEPWSMAHRTLTAMLAQRFPYPYDVWLCDEDPSEQALRWCAANGVRVSSRSGVAAYHRATWPRRTRCKEGNLAYFYDHWGYRDYDVVAQLDCDHVPQPTYLAEITRPFADPAIGYVAAPSVCDANSANSWSARGRLYREATFHGPVQLGLNGLAPLCIGSHYAVRTKALRDIGGLGPELAEDFSTTFLLTSAGWHGTFAIDAEAHGDGPLTVADMLTQEFQWSRSLTTLLYDLVPDHLRRLRVALRLQFAFQLSYYPLLAVVMVVGLALPPIAAVTGLPWVNVNYFEYLVRLAVVSLWLPPLTLLLRRRGLLRPRSAPVVSWENMLFALTRWPYVAWGVLAATRLNVRPRQVSFKVTPKARTGLEPLPTRLVLPYTVITVVLSAAALLGERSTHTLGYVFLCILGALCYAAVGLAVPVLHMVEAARAARLRVRSAVPTVIGPLLVGVVALLPLAAAIARYPLPALPLLTR